MLGILIGHLFLTPTFNPRHNNQFNHQYVSVIYTTGYVSNVGSTHGFIYSSAYSRTHEYHANEEQSKHMHDKTWWYYVYISETELCTHQWEHETDLRYEGCHMWDYFNDPVTALKIRIINYESSFKTDNSTIPKLLFQSLCPTA